MWCYKVNLAPFVVRRSLFAEVGGFNTNFSCAGNPGIGLDFELSIRLWKLGWKVGLFDPGFKHAIGNSKSSGTHAGVQKKIRDANEARNNMMMYQVRVCFAFELCARDGLRACACFALVFFFSFLFSSGKSPRLTLFTPLA